MQISAVLSKELNISVKQIEATVNLLDEGATVPFIARYRKEVTGSLDDTQLRNLQERLQYYRELEERRLAILKSITEQEKLTPELKQKIEQSLSKTELEDLYLPYKSKRQTKAQIAREAGLQPLAEQLLIEHELIPEIVAEKYLNPEKNINSIKEALDGAKQILMEKFSEEAELLQHLRTFMWDNAELVSAVQSDKQEQGKKFQDYFDFSEAIAKIPSHRALALFRARKEGIITVKLQLQDNDSLHCYQTIANAFAIPTSFQMEKHWLWGVVEWTWKIKLSLKIELELLARLKEQAEQEAIKVFQDNLSHLLMAAPAGNKVTMGLDPGLRTGVKCVVVDGTGKLLEYTTIFPHPPKNQYQQSLLTLEKLAKQYQVSLLSIGNGTASRETERLVIELMQKNPELQLTKVVVSEAGASIYSASALAAKEFPNLDVTYRGAVSIARRLQDPLAELVKIDPKSIGVGQYQHDVNQHKLTQSLNAVVEDSVNAVGADINTASVKLLASISGLNENLAQNIIEYREQHGRFKSRIELKDIPRMGPKTFQQAIGFLRIIDGDNPLDASSVHPESYPVVENVLKKNQIKISELMGNNSVLSTLNPKDYVTEKVGLPTIRDIFNELQKPGRDPRPEFKTAQFAEGVESITDLKPGMKLEGVVSNVTNFGAFVDIGVHQDGLVHVSELADKFVKDPQDIVKVGDIVNVTVLEVDRVRKRIQLSMKQKSSNKNSEKAQPVMIKNQKAKQPKMHSGLAQALSQALDKGVE